jgi:putative transposase
LRHDSKLFLPYQGDYQGKGRPRKYGDRLTLDNLPEDSLRKEEREDDILTRIYQLPVWHELFPVQLNLVMIVKTNLKTGKTAKVLLFSDDLTLSYDLLIQYYSLRFQIEFAIENQYKILGIGGFYECWGNSSQQCGKSFLVHGDFFTGDFIQNARYAMWQYAGLENRLQGA